MIFVTLLAFRWPTVTYNRQLDDPDESQTLAGAITLTHDPVFWRSVDGTTQGPLDQYVFALPHLVGLPIDYATGRFVLLMLTAASLIAAWLGLRTFIPERMARLAIVPALTLYALSSFWGVVQVGTEDVPVALLLFGLCGTLIGWRNLENGRPGWRAFLCAGLCLGAVPFAKLQGVPPALWLGAGACTLVLCSRAEPGSKARSLAAVLAGAVTVPFLFGLMVVITGMTSEFWEMYVLNNVAYSQQKHFPSLFILKEFLCGRSLGYMFPQYFFPIFAVSVAGLAGTGCWRRRELFPVLLVIGFGLCCLYAMVAPGREYHHYPRIYFIAAAMTAGTLAAGPYLRAAERQRWAVAGAIALAFVVITVGPQFRNGLKHRSEFIGTYRAEHVCRPNAAAELILRHARPGEAVAQWGWEPRLYVQTQLAQATREAHTQRQIETGSQQSYYIERFIADLKKSAPPVFVDSVGPKNFAYEDRTTQGHEVVPELRRIVAETYELVGDVVGVRVYARKSRPENR